MTDGQKLRQFIENQSKSIKRIYTDLGLSKQGFYNYFDSVTMEDDTKRKIEKYFGKPIFALEVNVDPNTKNAPVDRFQTDTDRSVKYVSEVLEKRKDSNLESLIESNRMMAAAMLADAENRTRLTSSNEALTLRVTQSESGLSETLEVFGATLATLREFVLDLCVKAKTHHSKEESRAAFRIRLNELLKNKKGENIRDGLGK